MQLARQILLALALLVPWEHGAAQDTVQEGGGRPNVFLDCQGPSCNGSYYRTEIDWVNWVRDPQDSHVHVIITSQTTASGGRAYQLDFIGRSALAEYRDQVLHRSLSTDTGREVLDGISHTLALGLARFSDAAGFRGVARVEGVDPAADAPGERVVAPRQVDDPWNLWVFRVGASGELQGEELESEVRLDGSLSASRVTPVWKLNFGGEIEFNRQEFQRSDGSTFVDERADWSLDTRVVHALAGHWSGGFSFNTARMTEVNQDVQVALMPAVEYSHFPYEEATRRALTAFYRIGPRYRNYIEQTIFERLAETRLEHALEVEFSQRQPWGDASVRVEGSQLLHDLSKNRLSVQGDVSVRIFRGLSINAEADVEWLNNQLYLSSEGETDEEILLRLRQRATDYAYGVEFGFSYQFGSIYNNVVNNRFGGGGFGG